MFLRPVGGRLPLGALQAALFAHRSPSGRPCGWKFTQRTAEIDVSHLTILVRTLADYGYRPSRLPWHGFFLAPPLPPGAAALVSLLNRSRWYWTVSRRALF